MDTLQLFCLAVINNSGKGARVQRVLLVITYDEVDRAINNSDNLNTHVISTVYYCEAEQVPKVCFLPELLDLCIRRTGIVLVYEQE